MAVPKPWRPKSSHQGGGARGNDGRTCRGAAGMGRRRSSPRSRPVPGSTSSLSQARSRTRPRSVPPARPQRRLLGQGCLILALRTADGEALTAVLGPQARQHDAGSHDVHLRALATGELDPSLRRWPSRTVRRSCEEAGVQEIGGAAPAYWLGIGIASSAARPH